MEVPQEQAEESITISEELISHANRCWDAERENANRLSARGTFLLSAIAAMFALGIFRIDWYHSNTDIPRINSVAAVYVIKSMLVTSLFSIGFGFLIAIGFSKKTEEQMKHSSDKLDIIDDVIKHPKMSDGEARFWTFFRIQEAYSDLRQRNYIRRKKLDLAQNLVILSFFLVGVSIAVYTFFSEPPSSGINHEQHTSEKISTPASCPSTRESITH